VTREAGANVAKLGEFGISREGHGVHHRTRPTRNRGPYPRLPTRVRPHSTPALARRSAAAGGARHQRQLVSECADAAVAVRVAATSEWHSPLGAVSGTRYAPPLYTHHAIHPVQPLSYHAATLPTPRHPLLLVPHLPPHYTTSTYHPLPTPLW
jgi:hypothetical protein